ncbi:tRNA (guanine(10)-N2)-methyltransferase homolog isoform X2 [Haliotis rubra]|nr:tRNA (guanine(10)-N2)-methyltransferase homolog isoform X2 [Haliotis rubra]XP_046547439.1 tRNA (guanine(10)-N2)-methyltransferase homolog isoform X2 [Haliotis rubra]
MAAPMSKSVLSGPAKGIRSQFLFHFASEHIEFKIPELKSIVSLLGFDITINEEKLEKKNPFLVVELPSLEHAKRIMNRTVLVKSLYELWGQGSNKQELYSNLRKYPMELSKPYLMEDTTFKIVVDTFNKKMLQKEIRKIEDITLEAVSFKGKVNLKDPTHTFSLLEYYGPEGSPPPDQPYLMFFGRWIANGQRDKIQAYHLQKRQFIGNTSMDACLSLIMANMGLVKENTFIFDPFVGTGSLLVASAHFGGYVMGTDIDYLLLHARGKPSRHNQTKRDPGESIRANLRQYGFEKAYIDVLVGDASKHNLWRHQGMFDAIITDPPYGIREPAKKIGNNEKEIPEDDRENHIPQRQQYQLSDIFKDLLNFSAKFLRLHGRLVFWFPTIRTEYSDANVPRHPSFQVVANSEQCLTSRVGRRLITMEKVQELQMEEDDLGASYDVDHFAGASFRDRYFRSLSRDTSPNSPRNQRKNINKAGEVCVENSIDALTISVEQSDNGETSLEPETAPAHDRLGEENSVHSAGT